MDFYLKLDPMIINKARQIKLLMMDVDGVLCDGLLPVSYTHLTLPTIYSV